MFYQTELESALRFGDIVEGFIHASSCINSPLNSLIYDYQIEINKPKFSVILSPCCSIGKGTILLSPLIPVLSDWAVNSYIREDMIIINKVMKRWHAITERHKQNMSPEEQTAMMNEDPLYCYLELFVYEGCNIFDNYNLSYKNQNSLDTNNYMIDFRNIYRVNCNKIKSAIDAPLSVKKKQLSVSTRIDLKNKLSYYFGKVPDEDIL